MANKTSKTFSIDIEVAAKLDKLPREAKPSQAVNDALKELLKKFKIK